MSLNVHWYNIFFIQAEKNITKYYKVITKFFWLVNILGNRSKMLAVGPFLISVKMFPKLLEVFAYLFVVVFKAYDKTITDPDQPLLVSKLKKIVSVLCCIFLINGNSTE